MKIIVISIFTLFNVFIVEAQKITLPECIEASLLNKDNIIALRTEAEVAELQTTAGYSGYLPRVTLNYDYRHYMIRPSTIIPIGLFSEIPTDETRAMRFGTPWQQNAGVSLYQPLVDLTIKSRIAESRIAERIKNSDVAVAEHELKTEVVKGFTNVWILQEQLKSALNDTIRTARTLDIIKNRFDEGQAQRTDLNNALLSRNNALISFRNATASVLKEKIYLGFLTGLTTEYLINGEFDFSFPVAEIEINSAGADSLPEINNLRLQANLLGRQLITEERKYIPVIGVDGFLGANQYTYEFDPLENSWYGTSYVGVSLQLPIISGENKSSRIKQLRLKAEGISSSISDRIKSVASQNMQLSEDIRQLSFELEVLGNNVRILTENSEIYRDKLAEGQVNASDLLEQEIELRKETARMEEIRARLTHKKIELITNSGKLEDFIAALK